jgi:nitrogen fixation/metabolism regulation signal transduction histidine kinase
LLNFEALLGLATTGACALGWFLSSRRYRAREAWRRDLTAAFAARNDAATIELAGRLSVGEEQLWRRLTTTRTALLESQNEEMRARRDLEDVLAALQDAVLVVDSEARLRFLNAAALRLFDVQIQDVLGAHLIEALPSFGIDAAMRAALREGQSSSTEIHLYAPKMREVFCACRRCFRAREPTSALSRFCRI